MSTRVYLGGLSHRAREKDVERFFRKFGRIRDISLKNGFAFVDFDDYRYALHFIACVDMIHVLMPLYRVGSQTLFNISEKYTWRR